MGPKPPQQIQNGKDEIKEIDTEITNNNNESKKKKVTTKLPSARELVSHYEWQVMDFQENSFKVIENLQGSLFRVINTSQNDKNHNNNRNASSKISRKLDVINAWLFSVDMKVANLLLQMLHRVAESVFQICNFVRNANNTKQ